MNVLTIGTFDILHFGHVAFLKSCRQLGEGLTVGVNSDRFAATFKQQPVMSEGERMHAISQLGYWPVLNDGPGRELIQDRQPVGVLAVGSDWARKDYPAQIGVDQDWLDQRRIILAYVPYVQHMPISTTEIVGRVVHRYVQACNRDS